SPDVFENISFSDITKKIEALKIYKEEIKKFPHPRSEEIILSLAKTRGSSVGLDYAEAFETIRCIK
ncbi:MAG: PIG-L family deacetylase, partial [bacterium]|nr:PIG-L family deacetylase [bacterium]